MGARPGDRTRQGRVGSRVTVRAPGGGGGSRALRRQYESGLKPDWRRSRRSRWTRPGKKAAGSTGRSAPATGEGPCPGAAASRGGGPPARGARRAVRLRYRHGLRGTARAATRDAPLTRRNPADGLPSPLELANPGLGPAVTSPCRQPAHRPCRMPFDISLAGRILPHPNGRQRIRSADRPFRNGGHSSCTSRGHGNRTSPRPAGGRAERTALERPGQELEICGMDASD